MIDGTKKMLVVSKLKKIRRAAEGSQSLTKLQKSHQKLLQGSNVEQQLCSRWNIIIIYFIRRSVLEVELFSFSSSLLNMILMYQVACCMERRRTAPSRELYTTYEHRISAIMIVLLRSCSMALNRCWRRPY